MICKCGHSQEEHHDGVAHCRVGLRDNDRRDMDSCVYFKPFRMKDDFADEVKTIRNKQAQLAVEDPKTVL